MLLEGGEPFVDVRALTAPGGALYALTLDAARPKIARIGSSDANGSTPSPKRRVRADDDTDDEGDDDEAVYRASKFAVRLVESAATELAGASRELTAAADEDVAQTAAEVSRAEVADVEDAVMVALLNARSAAARAERRRLLQQIAQRATDWVCAVQPSLGALPARLNAAMAERAADAKRAADAPATPTTPAVMDHRVVQELQRDLASARAEVATAKEEAAAAASDGGEWTHGVDEASAGGALLWSNLLNNRWNVFTSLETHVTWYTAPARLADGSVVDLWARGAPVRAARYSVWPGWLKPASFRIALLIGLVTMAAAVPSCAMVAALRMEAMMTSAFLESPLPATGLSVHCRGMTGKNA